MSSSIRSASGPWSWSRPTLLAGVGTALTVAVWVWLAVPLALLFGGVLAVGVFALSAPFAFALGQVLVFGVMIDGTPVGILLAESGLLLILLSEYASTTHSRRRQLATVATIAIAGAVGFLAVILGGDVWIIATAGVVLTALTAYGLHRVELVRLDLVLEDP